MPCPVFWAWVHRHGKSQTVEPTESVEKIEHRLSVPGGTGIYVDPEGIQQGTKSILVPVRVL